MVAIAAALTPIALLGDLVSLGTLMAFIMVCYSVLHLRKSQPDLPRPFKTPYMPYVPLLGMATCGYLVFSIFFGTDSATGDIVLTASGKEVLHYTGPYMIFGVLVYVLYGQFHSKLHKTLQQDKVILEEESNISV